MKRGLVKVLLATLLGIAVGLTGDLAADRGFELLGDYGASAPVLGPFAAVLGGSHIDAPNAVRVLFFLCGFAFVPVYFGLAYLMVNRPRPLLWLGLTAWCAVSFFQVLHRIEAIMGV